jgi:hypothetical protein
MNWGFGRKWWCPYRGTVPDWCGGPKESHKNAVGIAGVLTESRARHLPHINLWLSFEVRFFGTVLLHAPIHALSSCYMHLCMLLPVLLFRPRVCVRSCSLVQRTCSYSIPFSCYMHFCMLGPVLLLHAPLHARSCSPVTRTCSCSVLFSYFIDFFVLGPVLLLHAPLHAPSCSVLSTSPCSVLFSCYVCSCSVLFSC